MHRDSDLHSPRKDDELERELRALLQGNRPSRVDEWRDPEPPADDDPSLRPGDLSHARTEVEDTPPPAPDAERLDWP
jgi:hypothetical protein